MIPSLPSRERGLKYIRDDTVSTPEEVAPLAGAWVEIDQTAADAKKTGVAPLAGAWVEITILNTIKNVVSTSLPSRERGLK